jgi:antirestriction protein
MRSEQNGGKTMATNLEMTAITQLEQADGYANEYGIPARAILAYWGNLDNDWDKIAEWVEEANDCYIGEVEGFNAHQWLGERMEELGVIDAEGTMGELRFYFDYEKFGRDLELGGDVWESDGFYFWNR